MLREPTKKKAAVVAAVISILVLAGWTFGSIPLSGEVPYAYSPRTEQYYLPIAIVFWTIDFVNHNEGLVVGLATVAIAIFTFQLRASTDRLWEAGEQQLEIARIASSAARQSAEALMNADRPHVMMMDLDVFVTGAPQGQPNAEIFTSFNLRNLGKSPAFVKEFCLCRQVGRLDPVPKYESISRTPHQIIPGGPYKSEKPIGESFVPASYMPALIEDKMLYHVFGMMRYEDTAKRSHIYRFCYRIYFQGHNESRLWNPEGGDAYWEYT